MNRKEFLKYSNLALLASLYPSALANPGTKSGPKRVVFFLQNQGLEPGTIRPEGTTNETVSLKGKKLPEQIEALQPYIDQMNIINGLHGLHTVPAHSAYYGALGGYRGGANVAPKAITIDSKLSELLPPAILPQLCIGMDSLENMKSNPAISTLSATGPGAGVYMHSDPGLLYRTLFGSAGDDIVKKQFSGEFAISQQMERIAKMRSVALPAGERLRFSSIVDGISDLNQLSKKLADNSDHLKKFLPKYDGRYSTPEFETDWHDALLDIGISSLQAGITNVLTVGSGRGGVYGSWYGIDVEVSGHSLGHMSQYNNPIWLKIRRYNCEMLVRIIKALEAVPECGGTMMNNTLIVYLSNNADSQHTKGKNWPFLTIGNWGGTIRTGQYVQVKDKRPINALYTSFLHAAGEEADRFNMDDKSALSFDPGSGPLKEILMA